MSPKRQISSKEIVADIRAGMTNGEIMAKHQLSERGLEGIYQKLIDAQILLDIELVGRMPVSGAASEVSEQGPSVPARAYVVFRLPVYDLDDMTVEGLVHHISEAGLEAGGINAEVGDQKTLLIQPDEFADVYPFTFDAVCVSAEVNAEAGDCVAGFEISSISDVGMGELRKLCQFLGLR